MAILLIGLAVLGLYMVSLPDVGFDTRKIELILYHKELGMIALALAALRLAWRISSALPRLVATLPDWQQVIARFVHLCFYGVMFALPITGWMMSSARNFPVSWFGWVQLPDLVGADPRLYERLNDLHELLFKVLVAVAALHAAGALKHHFIDRNDVLRRMLPFGRTHD